jgi:hypothetical protein
VVIRASRAYQATLAVMDAIQLFPVQRVMSVLLDRLDQFPC